ncbi:Uncharacterised protein [Chlamydia trachomatis]|nr:Uncharacterised protein [Chlamydia trachomatis]
MPFAAALEQNFSRSLTICSWSFFPIARRKTSPSPKEYFANEPAICMTCSW